MNIQDYKYKYETHLHTSQGSACGCNTGAQMAQAYKAAGYAGIFVTDHHFGGNCRPDRSQPWEDWVEQFCSGYEDAAAEGQRIGLPVFFGWESGFDATEFLVYGPDKQWMLRHPQLAHCTVREQYELVQAAGGLVIQAHPFRQRFYIKHQRLFFEYCDGVEAVNAQHSHPTADNDSTANDRAFAYAQHHSLPVTAGSDMHNTTLRGAGVCFKTPISSVADYISRIKQNDDYILTDGNKYYDKLGGVLQ